MLEWNENEGGMGRGGERGRKVKQVEWSTCTWFRADRLELFNHGRFLGSTFNRQLRSCSTKDTCLISSRQ